jgi:hypothetical protein
MTDISKTSFKDYIMVHESVIEDIDRQLEEMMSQKQARDAHVGGMKRAEDETKDSQAKHPKGSKVVLSGNRIATVTGHNGTTVNTDLGDHHMTKVRALKENEEIVESFTVKNAAGKVVHTAYSENAARAKAIELSKTGEKHTSGFDRQAMVKESDDLEEAAFDWGKTKPDVSRFFGKGKKSDTKKSEGGLIHKGTYGSEDHRAPNSVNTPKEKQSVGRPAGAYGGAYKIDKGARDSQEYKDALSAKVRAAKAQGFEDRTYFKDLMNASLLNHAKYLAKKADDEAKNK